MASALIEHKRINTTLAKAKALRQFIEPIVTKAKDNSTHSRRIVFSQLHNKVSVTELFGPIAEAIGDRPGGYTRVIRTGFRKSDGAEMAMIEFVDFNEVYEGGKTKNTGGGRRRRRGGRSKTSGAQTNAPATNVKTSEEEE